MYLTQLAGWYVVYALLVTPLDESLCGIWFWFKSQDKVCAIVLLDLDMVIVRGQSILETLSQ